MDLVKRFLKYVSFDTQSDENSLETPSTSKQLILAKYLEKELKSIGCEDVVLDKNGIVYATISANCDNKVPTIGFIAHMDTSPDCSGANIKPRIIRNYDGKDIVLNESTIMKVEEFPTLKNNIGEDLIVTDGTTLLGADDKAGIAIIVEFAYRIINNKNLKHGKIKIAFTPDEEVGRGTENFDVEYFGCDFAYTLDGGDIRFIEYENFNAASAIITINGINIHPGSAKNKMINSILVANEFNSLLPEDEIPSKTEGYQGFNHLNEIQGSVEKTTMHYILRNHDDKILKRQIDDFNNAATTINNKYNRHIVDVDIKMSYRNMKEVIVANPQALNMATNAYDSLKMPYEFLPIRGGTDGATLSFKGLPCPNLGDGGYNFHGRFEYVSTTQMQKMVKVLTKIVEIN